VLCQPRASLKLAKASLDAQHLVAGLVGRFEGEQQAVAALALTPDSNVVTAITNDYSYDVVFLMADQGVRAARGCGVRQLERAFANCGTRFTTARLAWARDDCAYGTRRRTDGRGRAHPHQRAETSTARIQEVHRTILHAMCTIIEAGISP
jgi:D-sedoheptulose 7-phosphate isomerase